MKVGDLVRYKKNKTEVGWFTFNKPYRVAIVTVVLPSGLSVFLSEFAKDMPHRIEDLEVVSESR